MKGKEILELIERTSDNNDADFRLIIHASLDRENSFLTERDFALEFSTSYLMVRRWANGINTPHPAMRKHIFKWIKERLEKKMCACPKICDCQNPPPDDWDGIDGVWHISEMCPKHNLRPWPHPDCQIH